MKKFGGIVLIPALIGAASCSDPSTLTGSTPAGPTVQFGDLKAMAGIYTLTIELDDSCHELPSLAWRRSYRAALEDRGWHFLVVRIDGGGFSAPIEIGDLFSGELSPLRSTQPELRWNSFDIGCDVAEPLGEFGALAVCGVGPVTRTPARLTATLTGHASVLRPGVVGGFCKGEHRFVFERTQ